MDRVAEVGVLVLYLLALINPVSKISVLSACGYPERREEFRALVTKASCAAVGILLGAMAFGHFVLSQVFRVQIWSLSVAGGAVLAWFGFNALRQGVFFEREAHQRLEDIAIAPLACPMIAGPATIAASVNLSATHGMMVPALAIVLAVAINHAVMLFARPIAALLNRMNVLGAVVRLTGLIVMAIGVQMILGGLAEWGKPPLP